MKPLPTAFEGQSIRRLYDEATDTWWFSVIDVVQILTGSSNSNRYWSDLKRKLAQESGDLAKQARDGKLKPADMSGACFTISSLGGIGGTYFAPIVNAPEVAILGVNKSAMKPVWDGKAFVPRLTLPLSLTADHRVIDGALATRFNVYVAELLADMRRMIV